MMVDKRAVMTALEPAQMSVPAMDRPSLALAWFMDSIRFEFDGTQVYLMCDMCHTAICEVEDLDTLRVMFNTALAHGCQT